MKYHLQHIFRITTLTTCILTLALAGIVPANAAPKHSKKSDKLVKKMADTGLDGFIDVIVVPVSDWSGSLTTDLNGRGAQLKKQYSSFKFKAYRIKEKD